MFHKVAEPTTGDNRGDEDKLDKDATAIVGMLSGQLANLMEQTSTSAVGTALVRLLAVVLANPANGDVHHVVAQLSKGLGRELERVRQKCFPEVGRESLRTHRPMRPVRRRRQ